MSEVRLRLRELGVNLMDRVYSIPSLAFRAGRAQHLEAESIANLSVYTSHDAFIREAY